MKILLTNDDGIHVAGIVRLAEFLRNAGNTVFLVAPVTEQSGVSSMITFRRPISAQSVNIAVENGPAIEGMTVDGTPVDCVRLGIFELCPWKPDMVISGINDGLNAGANVNFSGTVAGAMTGASLGFKSISISMESGTDDFHYAAESSWPIIQQLADATLPAGAFLNLNFPTAAIAQGPVHDFEMVPAETNPMGYEYQHLRDPKNKLFYWASNNPPPQPSAFLTDTQVLLQGKATLSLLTSNLNFTGGNEVITHLFQTQASEQ